jgi:D-psicose/D-tagatose/L-ribulose 3-epimerase
MKLGISIFAWTSTVSNSHIDLISQIRDLGFSVCEVPMLAPTMLPSRSLRNAFEESGIECTVCSILPRNVNPISPDAAERKKSIHHLHKCVEVAAEMGARLIGGPLFAPIGYLPGHRPTEDELRWATECFQSITGLLDQHQMTLALEPVNRSESFFLRTVSDARKLCRAINHPRVGITIDTFHANIEEKSTPDAIISAGADLRHVHMSENDRGVLGSGNIDFPSVIDSLTEINYEGVLIVEGFGYSPLELNAPGYLLADKTVSPIDVAKGSLNYLRNILIQQ